ncbi:hypothetical protein CEXT_677541 [Caerostris extrusa]|uniref:Uncharacterized protein n=1 Tax=Caerostris extrusa TaxID=172846 RepID=A0AAV4N2W0_CAEEX|nr:hypothetical protein CEXT_677541 [Caerostris extrusa]
MPTGPNYRNQDTVTEAVFKAVLIPDFITSPFLGKRSIMHKYPCAVSDFRLNSGLNEKRCTASAAEIVYEDEGESF